MVDRACTIPGQNQTRLRDELLSYWYSPDAPSLAEPFGEGATETSLRGALEPKLFGTVLRDEDFMTLTPLRRPKRVGLFGVVSDERDGEPLGYFVWDECQDASTIRYDQIEYICARSRLEAGGGGGGLGAAILDAGSALFASHGSERTLLEAAWLGRYRWPLDGFDFQTDELKKKFFAYWNDFRSRMSLNSSELFLDRGDGRREDFSEQKLQHLWDFAAIRSVSGPVKVEARLVWSETPVHGTYEVGKAFLLAQAPPGWDSSRFGQTNFCTYHLHRPHAPSSDGQIQHERYRASRNKRLRDGGIEPS